MRNRETVAGLIVMILIVASVGSAQIGQWHQGALAAADGSPVVDGFYTFSFSLWTESVDGELLWHEEHSVAVVDGGFEVQLGTTRPIDVEIARAWLETVVDGDRLEPRTVFDGRGAGCTIDGTLTTESILLQPQPGDAVWLSFNGADLKFSSFTGGAIRFSTAETNGGSSTARMSITNTGEVGVGTFTPAAPLHVEGGDDAALTVPASGYLILGDAFGSNLVFDNNEIMARSHTSTNWLFLQNEGGDVYVNGVVAHSSDRRLKEKIRPLGLGLEQLMQLEPVTFEWKNREDSRRIGLIAQDVLEVVEEVVYEDDSGRLAIAYPSLVPLLVKAIQDQQQEIDELQGQHADLIRQNREILDRLSADLAMVDRHREAAGGGD